MADGKRKASSLHPGDRLVLAIVSGLLVALLGVHCALRAGAGKPAPQLGHITKAGSHLVDINRAQWWELQALQGIGEKRARNIVEVRTRRGGFKSVDELGDVTGIGPKTLDRLRPYLTARAAERTDGERR